jgi:D-ribose pyranase
MIEKGLLNRDLATLLSKMGHGDQFLLCDAGFAIPEGIPVVDLSIAVNIPTVDLVLAEILKVFSVEKVIFAREQKDACPAKLEGLIALFDPPVEQQTLSHVELRQRSRFVKGVIRTGDFSAFTNLILVSGAGERWIIEHKGD